MTTLALGTLARSFSKVAKPSPSGMRMSSSTTSGLACSASLMVSFPVAAWPTISMSDPLSRVARPVRMTS